MPRKRHKPEDVLVRLGRAEVMTAQGTSSAEAIRSIGLSEVTCHRWRNEFGGARLDQVRRLKALEQENPRLRGAASDFTPDKLIPQKPCGEPKVRAAKPTSPSCRGEKAAQVRGGLLGQPR